MFVTYDRGIHEVCGRLVGGSAGGADFAGGDARGESPSYNQTSARGSVRSALAGHADAEARRSVLTALPCATLVPWPSWRIGERCRFRKRRRAWRPYCIVHVFV